MKNHLLSGDSLVKPFADTGIEGDVYVCRECLVGGPADTSSLEMFWNARESFLSTVDNEDIGYQEKVVDEFTRLWNASDGNEVVFWFERELFCQINFLFSLWMLRNTDARFSVVYPLKDGIEDPWTNWSELSPEELTESYHGRVRMNHDDVFQGVEIWEAFAVRDVARMREAADSRSSEAFPTISEIVDLVETLDSKPAQLVSAIIQEKGNEFGPVFREFIRQHPQYGFGDLQLKRIFDTVVES